MKKFFNVSGPCFKTMHYMIEASTRLQGVEQLVEMGQYFVIHASRQSGKTTYLQDLTSRLNAAGEYYALYCSLESLQGVADAEKGVPGILDSLVMALENSAVPFQYNECYEQDKRNRPLVVLTQFLSELSRSLDKRLVILFDEADCLGESTLIAFLRQLRSGYNNRGMTPFVYSLALVGMRNIRDYKAHIRPDRESLGSASPFNIVTESLTLKNFTRAEIAGLYGQHTDETGQEFANEAIDLVHRQTQGQPWLVNAIAREIIVKMLQSDYSQVVTAAMVETAIQTIILRRDTHIDSLLERLKEERVQRVIEPLILGESVDNRLSDDFQYVKDLGLIIETNNQLIPANPIYGEVIVRTLSHDIQRNLQETETPYAIPRYLKDGKIDMDFLMRDFQQFWRENSDIWKDRFLYKEATPHLALMGFLQRVVNGGGRISREMAAGSGRIDICLEYDGIKYPIELKLRRRTDSLEKGFEQTARYMDIFGCKEGWLVLFDLRKKLKWDDKIYLKKKRRDGKTITVVGV